MLPSRTTGSLAGRMLAATVAAGGLALGLGAVTAVPAAAETPDEVPLVGDGCVPEARLDQARTRILEGIDLRLARLGRLGTAVEASPGLTEAHRSAITATVDETTTGLTALRAEVEAGTDGCALAEDGRAVVDEFRVFVVVVPQSRLAMAADRIGASESRLDEIATRAQAAIDAAAGAGRDVTAARAALATYVSEVDAALAGTASVGDGVLALQPADWREPAAGTLEQARTDLTESVGHLREARAALASLRDALRG